MLLENRFLKDFSKMFRLVESGGTFVAFDTETTGLSAESNRILEIGAVKFNKDGILSSFSTLVDPQCHIPYNITEITGIDDSMIKGKPVIKNVLKDFLPFIEDVTIIAHNAHFDLRFLRAECERNNFKVVKNNVVDTLQFSRWAFPEEEKYNQVHLANLLSINVQNAHRAYDDAFVCGKVFLRLIEETSDRQKGIQN